MIRGAGGDGGFVSTCRLLASGVLVIAMCLLPFAPICDAKASEGHSHSTMTGHGAPSPDGHADMDHRAFHCGAASYMVGSQLESESPTGSATFQSPAGDESLLSSIDFERDPPVPRDSFSQVR